MRLRKELAFLCLSGVLTLLAGAPLLAGQPAARMVVSEPAIPVALDWTPPELASLVELAEVRNSFTLDRTMLGAAAALLPESESGARQSIRKLDGVSIHLYRFHEEGRIDPAQVDLVRQAYHARGWKHLISAADKSTPMHNGKTDLWLAVDGMDVRGGTLLVVTPRSVSLVTFAGDLNPLDILRLRGHFGIPNFSGDKFDDEK
jgi:hypothetical protein